MQTQSTVKRVRQELNALETRSDHVSFGRFLADKGHIAKRIKLMVHLATLLLAEENGSSEPRQLLDAARDLLIHISDSQTELKLELLIAAGYADWAAQGHDFALWFKYMQHQEHVLKTLMLYEDKEHRDARRRELDRLRANLETALDSAQQRGAI